MNMSAFDSNSGIRELLDVELDHVAGGAGFLENLLGDIEKGVNSLLGVSGGILGQIEGVVNAEVSNLGSALGSLPIVGGLLGQLI